MLMVAEELEQGQLDEELAARQFLTMAGDAPPPATPDEED